MTKHILFLTLIFQVNKVLDLLWLYFYLWDLNIGNDYKINDDLSNEADKIPTNVPGVSDYIPYGNSSSPNRADGYLFYLDRNFTVESVSEGLKNYNILSANWIHLVFQMAILNKNNVFYSIHQIVFKKQASGELYSEYDVYSMSNSYETSYDYFRAFLETVFIILTSFYLYKVIKSILFNYLELEKEYLGKQTNEIKKNTIFFRVFGFDKISFIDKSFAVGLLSFLYRVLVTTIRSLYQLLLSIYKYITSSIFSAINLLSIWVTIVCITFWVRIITTDDFVLNKDGSSSSAFDFINLKINYFATYKLWTSINTLLMFCKILQFFTFSSKLSMFYEVISNGLFDIVFFTIMQIIIMVGYSLMGYMLFGISDENFSTFSNSWMSLFLMIIGNISIFDIETSNIVFLYFFGITFTLINVLLLNMLVAIYASHYFQYYTDQGDTKTNELYLFLRILGGHKASTVNRF